RRARVPVPVAPVRPLRLPRRRPDALALSRSAPARFAADHGASVEPPGDGRTYYSTDQDGFHVVATETPRHQAFLVSASTVDGADQAAGARLLPAADFLRGVENRLPASLAS